MPYRYFQVGYWPNPPAVTLAESIESALLAYLLEDANVSALVGDRILSSMISEKTTLPAIAYERVTSERVASMDGPSGLAYPQFRFSCWAKDYTTAAQIGDALRIALDGYKGLMGAVDVQAIFMVSRDDVGPDLLSGIPLWGQEIVFQVWHEEQV